MKKIILFLSAIIFAQIAIAQNNKHNSIEEVFSQYTWVSADSNDSFAKFGYDKNTFTLEHKIIPESDIIFKILNINEGEELVYIGKYKNLKVYYNEGSSLDPHFFILNSSNKLIWGSIADAMCISSTGIIYIAGNTNKMFDERRKFIIKNETIQEIKQPYLYVGVKGELKKPVKLYSKKDNKGSLITTLQVGHDIEVLVAEELTTEDDNTMQMNYLVRTSFGLVGWLRLTSDDTYYLNPVVQGLGVLGD